MEKFNKPINLNGTELKDELAKAGIVVDSIIDFADGSIGFECDDKVKAEKIVKVHNGNIEPKEPTIQEKLSNVGLTIDDLRGVLGLT